MEIRHSVVVTCKKAETNMEHITKGETMGRGKETTWLIYI
jgi:hypothetical protein